jgi:hypothetical protein
MRAYGVHRHDCGCCPGHDKFSPDSYNSARSRRAHSRARRTAHKIARARAKVQIRVLQESEARE